MWRPIATIAAVARDVELEEPVLKLSWYSIYINLVLNIFIFLGGGPTLSGNYQHQYSSTQVPRYRMKFSAVWFINIRD